MPEVKHFHQPLVFMQLVINKNRTMHQFAYPRPFAYSAAHTRKASEQVHVIEQGVAKTGGCIAVVFCDVSNDLREIV
jgi:hypothetical protein